MSVDKYVEAGESRVRVRHCSAVVVVICFTYFLRLRVDYGSDDSRWPRGPLAGVLNMDEHVEAGVE